MHGIGFETTVFVFDDPLAATREDPYPNPVKAMPANGMDLGQCHATSTSVSSKSWPLNRRGSRLAWASA